MIIELIVFFIFLVLVTRIVVRGYFWKDKQGNKLTFKEFLKRWKDGVETTSPLQQTKINLWSYPLVLGGIITGLVIMGLRREWWLVLILSGSLPMTLMGLLSTYQKYKACKRIDEEIRKLRKIKK
jgi:hypothetical protein